MVGRIVGLVCCLLCAFPFLVIGIYNRDSIEPVNFRSGDTSLKDKVKDVKGYNTEMTGFYKKCAFFFLMAGILFCDLSDCGNFFVEALLLLWYNKTIMQKNSKEREQVSDESIFNPGRRHCF